MHYLQNELILNEKHHIHLLMIGNKQYLTHSFAPCQLKQGYFLIMFLPKSSYSMLVLITAFLDLKYPTIWSIASSQTYSVFFSLLRAASTLAENCGIKISTLVYLDAVLMGYLFVQSSHPQALHLVYQFKYLQIYTKCKIYLHSNISKNISVIHWCSNLHPNVLDFMNLF